MNAVPIKLLIIDDNLKTHQALSALITPAPESAYQSMDALEKIQIAHKKRKNFAVVCIHAAMINSLEIIQNCWAIDKDLQLIIYSDHHIGDKLLPTLGLTNNLIFLKLPFEPLETRQLIAILANKWQLLQDTRSYSSLLKKQVESRTASLQESLSLVKATLESCNDGILVVDNQQIIVDYNQKFQSMWQIPQAILNEKNELKLRQFMQNQLINPELFANDLQELYDDLFAIKINNIRLKDGRTFEYYCQPQKIKDKIVGRVFDFRDITKRAKIEETLTYQARHDQLTNLPNRLVLLEKIKELTKNKTAFVLLFLDIDRFKLINDSFNHEVGDEVLKVTAKRLERLIRSNDILARLGGDEFVVIFSGVLSEKDIMTKIAKLQHAFEQPYHIGQRHVLVSVSIGISRYPEDGMTPSVLLRNADAAMYHSKEKKSAQFYNEDIKSRDITQLRTENDIQKALENKEFYLCYQPQFDTLTGKIIAVEALIRWLHPQKGSLLPIEFIPLCEETGLIIPVGEWVIYTVCKQIQTWLQAGISPPRIAINLSAQQFLSQDIFNLMDKTVKETEIDPAYLEIELTENTLTNHPEIITAITRLKKLGVTISIDDFGTGYSSLSYLKQVAVERLKIDNSFIKNININPDDEVIIRAIIAIAKHLNLEVVAEGVETAAQFNFLKQNGCDHIQGYYFSKPLCIKELESYLYQAL